MSCGMRSRTESLSGINPYLHHWRASAQNFLMFPIVNHAFSSYHYRFKTFLFPYFVPISVFCFLHGIGHDDMRHGKRLQTLVQCLLAERCFLHISFHSVVAIFKGFKAGISCKSSYQITSSLQVVGCRDTSRLSPFAVYLYRGNRKVYFPIFHFSVKF